MTESTAEAAPATQHEVVLSGHPPPPPLPPGTQRRPRVREVRSRFMSPAVPSSPSPSDLHLPNAKSPITRHVVESRQQQQQRSISAQRRRQLDLEPTPRADDNRPEISRSLETPFVASQSKGAKFPGRASRSDTPTVSTSMDRIVPSRFRQTPQSLQRSISGGISGGATAAAKLVHSSGMSLSGGHASIPKPMTDENSNFESGSVGDNENPVQLCRAKSISDLRSSMPEVDLLPSVSNRLLTERNGNRVNPSSSDCSSSRISASPCSRFLNSPLPSCEPLLLNSTKGSEKAVLGLSKQYVMTPTNGGKVCLPPVPPCTKNVADGKKARKASSHQEDVHSLRMLHNHLLQWRFTNAKAEASMQSQKRESEKMLFSLAVKLEDLYNSVGRKRAELGILQRAKLVSDIVESQMPYLDEWSDIGADCLTSLSEATQALSNASIRLPVGGNVRVDVREVGDALASSANVMDGIASHIKNFLPKAEEVEVFVSELARVVGGERVVVEECGNLLIKAHLSQVDECSLRSQIIQLLRYSQSVS